MVQIYQQQVLVNPIEITLQTAGNRSMLGNDFTQVNDLGYGLIVNNGGLSEMVSHSHTIVGLLTMQTMVDRLDHLTVQMPTVNMV